MGSIVSRTLSVGQEHELLQKLEAAGLTEQDAQKVINSRKNELAKALVALIREKELVTGDTYPLTVNRDLSLEEMITAGFYDWKNGDIKTKHVPIEGRGTTEVVAELVHFDRFIKFEEAIKELDQRGLRPAKIEELLAFGAKYPFKQREFPIVALGSVWQGRDGDHYVAYLYKSASERALSLDWIKTSWDVHWRFLAVCKSDEQPNHIYRVTVDRNKKFKEMIKAGRYDWINSDITEKRYPVEGSGTEPVEIILRHYNKVMTYYAALSQMDQDGLRPIKIEELLALGANEMTRDLQREFPIISLGSACRTLYGGNYRHYSPYLEGNGSKRHLDLYCLATFHEFCRFAAIRKS